MTSLHFKRIWSYQDSPSTFLCVIPTSVPHSDASHHLLFLHASYQDSREKGSKCANYNKLILNYLLQVYSKLPLGWWASLMSQMVKKNLPAMQEIQVRSLEQEDPLEKGMATQSSILPYLDNSMNRGAWQATVHEVTRVRLN